MIEKLTKENLIKLGFKESDVNELYNTKENYSLQCNEGNVFVSKPENKIYTGVDFYRKTYFTEKNINFPFKCPDLFNEYFELSLAKFFEKQKAELSIHFDEKTQFEKFILLEINRSKENIKDTKEFIKAHPDTRWHGKERANNVLETYIQFLDNKLFINEKINNKLFLKEKPLHKKLTVDHIALKMVYEGKTDVTRKEHGDDLYNKVRFWYKDKNRTGNLDKIDSTDLVIENRMKKIETVLELLPEGKKAKALGEIAKLKNYLSK